MNQNKFLLIVFGKCNKCFSKFLGYHCEILRGGMMTMNSLLLSTEQNFGFEIGNWLDRGTNQIPSRNERGKKGRNSDGRTWGRNYHKGERGYHSRREVIFQTMHVVSQILLLHMSILSNRWITIRKVFTQHTIILLCTYIRVHN